MASRSLFSRYLILLCISLLASVFFLPGLYGIPYPQELGPQTKFRPYIKKDNLNAIIEMQPKVVLLGDSVLHEGVDQELLSEEMGIKTYSIGLPGTASAVWYLVLKNTIVDAPVRPKYIVVLFRDTILTIPSFRTFGNYFAILDDYAGSREPLVTQLAFINSMSPAEKLAQQYLPLYSVRWKMRESMDVDLRYTLPLSLLNCPAECTDNAMNVTFGRQVMDAIALQQAVYDSGVLYAPENLNFEKQIDKSFLPAMIHVAQENNITLIFVRMKNLTYPDYASETPALRAYIKSLKTYLAEQDNVNYIDLAHDERILNSYFEDLLHLNAEGREAFTKILAGELMPYVK
jgi:hypothetical protein